MPKYYFNIYKIIFFPLWVTFSACNVDKHKKIDSKEVQFETTANSVIFFKNLRQSYYDKQENSVAKVDIYRNQKQNKSETYPTIHLAIVHHWRSEKAYIMVEVNELLNKEARIEILWKNAINQANGKYIFDFGDMEQHYRFATAIYQSIQDKHQLHVKSEGKWLELMPSEEDKETFRKTMLDYLRLVNVVK